MTVPAATTIDYRGQTYRIAEKVGLAPLMRFGKLAKSGADSADMTALAVMYDVIEQCFSEVPYCAACESQDSGALVAPEDVDWCCPDRRVVASEFDRFMDVATVERWDHEEILAVIGEVLVALSGRPTGRRPVSSTGPSTVLPSSEDSSSLRVQRRLEGAGRADLAVAVLRRREFFSALQAS